MAHPGRHAVVIGASMGGLVAARALADHYDVVTVIERDLLADDRDPRKGVPQGQHAHGLLARGREALEQMFPGLAAELIAETAVSGDIVDDCMWFNHGVYLNNAPSALIGLGVSRPTLEASVRRRVRQLPGLTFHEEIEAAEPVFDPALRCVTGVRIQPSGGQGETETIEADLVVDASGRGSRSPAWLEALGYARPREEMIRVNIGYMTRLYHRRPGQLAGKQAVIMAACQPDWRIGVVLAQEEDRWIVTLGGYFDDHPPADEAGFLEFARSLQRPEVFEIARDAEPLSAATAYQFSANLRRHYEELKDFPAGYLVFGDALCSFNPIYGQGMTVASTEALALSKCLAAGRADIAGRFFRAARPLIDIPWQIAVGSDLQHPKVEGKRSAQVRFINWYLAKLYAAAQHDSVLAERFLEVANLMRRPLVLLQPRTALRVWRGNRGLARASMQRS